MSEPAGLEVGTAVTDQVNVIYSDGTEEIAGLDPKIREVASQLQNWVTQTRNTGNGSLLDRRRFENTNNPFANIVRAKHVMATNDLIAGLAEVTEGLAFEGMQWESTDPDIADLFNQMAAEQNLDEALRKMWREEYAVSQVVVGTWWINGTFKVRGKTKAGNRRKASYDVYYPSKLTIFDPTRIVPVGLLMFGMERLAWIATPSEMAAYAAIQRGEYSDPLMERFFVGRYIPEGVERDDLMTAGIDINRLLLMDHTLVRRHTATRSDYERWAPVRLRGVFPLLDLREQMMEADRVALVGAANYILLVKKGDKDNPGKPAEVQNLREGFRTLAKVPVIFSDHRLNIEIITPKQDYTLQRDKYDLLDARIARRVIYAMGAHGQRTTANDSSALAIGKTTAKVLQGRRHMLRRFLEVILAREVIEHTRNAAVFEGKEAPSLAFVPANISIVDDAAIAAQIMALRTQKEISRETTLEFFGFDQQVEAMRRTIEEEQYDDIFQTQVPFSSPYGQNPNGQGDGQQQGPNGGPAAPAVQAPRGKEGGRPVGGGKPSANPTKVNRTDNGTTSPKGS